MNVELPLNSSVVRRRSRRMRTARAPAQDAIERTFAEVKEQALPEVGTNRAQGKMGSKSESLVRKGGLEPPRFYPPDPKSGASANSATFAQSLPGSPYQALPRSVNHCTAIRIFPGTSRRALFAVVADHHKLPDTDPCGAVFLAVSCSDDFSIRANLRLC